MHPNALKHAFSIFTVGNILFYAAYFYIFLLAIENDLGEVKTS